MPSIKVQGSLNADQFDACCTEDDHSGEFIVDLQELQFIEPTGTVRLAGVISNAVRKAIPVRVQCPRRLSPGIYLSRIGFASFLDGLKIAHELPVVRHHESANATMVELQQFDLGDDRDVEGAFVLANFMFDRANESLPAPTSDEDDHAATLHAAIYEVADNCLMHAAEAGAWGFMAAQIVKRASGRVVLWAVCDTGRGVRASFDGSRHAPTSDGEAIAMALDDRISSRGDRRGIGLPNAARWMTSNGGSLRVRSGAAEVHVMAQMTYPRSRHPWIRGTVVSGTMPC